MRHPVVTDPEPLRRRLAAEEKDCAERLAGLEDRLRRFEEVDRPAYDRWLRLEFGPGLEELEELEARIREKTILARRIDELMERHGLHPREALFVATHRPPPDEERADEPGEGLGGAGTESGADPGADARQRSDARQRNDWDPEEIEARRQAKRDAKRAERRAARAAQAQGSAGPEGAGGPGGAPGALRRATGTDTLVGIYRKLARKLHPDSPGALRGEKAQTLWIQVQTAYQSRSLDRLLAIWTWLSVEQLAEGSEAPTATFSDWQRRIREMRRSVERLEKQVTGLKQDPAWDFGGEEGLPRKKLRARVKRDLEGDLARAQEAMEALDDFIAAIGPPREPSYGRDQPRGGARRRRR